MSGRRAQNAEHDDALFAGERAVLDRFDRGEMAPAIARELRLDRAYVARVISKLSGRSCNHFDTMVRRGSAQLLAAIRASGGCYS